jgi:WhiB family redox-sensing transcriptional regulator
MDNWRASANCQGIPTEDFFPFNDSTYRNRNLLVRVCAGCSVKEECLEEALSVPETLGWWAGTTEKDRRLLKRRRKYRLSVQ